MKDMNETVAAKGSGRRRAAEEPGPFHTAIELADMVRQGEVSPSELVDYYLARIAALEPKINAFCQVTADEARQTARKLDNRLHGDDDLPPFFGVPIGIKDLHPVKGWPLCSASEAVDHAVMPADAPAVKVLRDAGFIFLGATTSPEFGTVSVTESARHGVTRNPWALTHSPGGSSGGSAASVAAGMLPIAHGSDGAGSIRAPASYCGLVGLKPSRARVPSEAHGLEGLVSEGVITQTVEDTAAVLELFARAPRRSWYVAPSPDRSYRDCVTESLPRLRIGLNLQPAFPVLVHQHAVQVARAAADLLTTLGHDVTEVVVPGLDPEWFQAAFDILYMTGSADCLIDDEGRLEPLNRVMRQRARATDSLTYVGTVYALQLRSAEMLQAWDGVDVILTPTNPILAPVEGWLWKGQDRDPWLPLRRAEQTAAFTVLANVLGLPAISLPLFSQPDGMPLGVQLVGGPWDDATVLALAAELERALPWRERHPVGLS